MRASFCSPCPAQNNFSLFFPVFSLPAGHQRLPFAPCAPPASDFLSSSLFFLWRRGTTGFLLLSMPRPPWISSLLPCFFSGGGAPKLFFFSHAPRPLGPQPHSHKNSDGSCLSADFRFHVFHMAARSFRQNTVSKSSPSLIAS